MRRPPPPAYVPARPASGPLPAWLEASPPPTGSSAASRPAAGPPRRRKGRAGCSQADVPPRAAPASSGWSGDKHPSPGFEDTRPCLSQAQQKSQALGIGAVHWQNGTEDSNCTEDPEFPATVTDLEAKCTESSILLKVTWSNLREQPIWRIGGETGV